VIPGVNLNPQREAAIHAKFSEWADHFQIAFAQTGLRFLLESYEALVRSLEDGNTSYSSDTGYYKFTNDLSVRDAIEVILDGVPDTERIRIAGLVTPIDQRYQLLQSGSAYFLPNRNRQARYPKAKFWWYYGLPCGVHE